MILFARRAEDFMEDGFESFGPDFVGGFLEMQAIS
jgi:hypothetical protein